MVEIWANGRRFIVGECIKCGAHCVAEMNSVLTCARCQPSPVRFDDLNLLLAQIADQARNQRPSREVTAKRVSWWRRLLAVAGQLFFSTPRTMGLLPEPKRCHCVGCVEELGSCRAERRARLISRSSRAPRLPVPGDGVERLG